MAGETVVCYREQFGGADSVKLSVESALEQTERATTLSFSESRRHVFLLFCLVSFSNF